MTPSRFPPSYACDVHEALVSAFPEIAPFVVERPTTRDIASELWIEIPSENSQVRAPLEIVTSHDPDGLLCPVTEFRWWEGWSADFPLTDSDFAAHRQLVTTFLRRLLNEELAPYVARLRGQIVGGGAASQDEAPIPVSQADAIEVRSWRGTFDRDLNGHWFGWPNNPADPFYGEKDSEN